VPAGGSVSPQPSDMMREQQTGRFVQKRPSCLRLGRIVVGGSGCRAVIDGERHVEERRGPAVLCDRLLQVPCGALRGRNGEVRLYSDLLLHNIGAALDDKIAQGNAMRSRPTLARARSCATASSIWMRRKRSWRFWADCERRRL
jgi:hypothetical protein